MAKDNLYSGAVDSFIGFLLLDSCGIVFNPQKDKFLEVNDDFSYIYLEDTKTMVELERLKISSFHLYGIRLSLYPSTRRLFTLEKENIDGEESLRPEPYNKVTTSVSRKWLLDFKGLKQWPR